MDRFYDENRADAKGELMPTRIRLATLRDIDRLVSLDDIASREMTRVAAVRRGVEASNCWVAGEGRRLLGYALLKKEFFGFDFIELIYVASSIRRRGIGRALIEHVERECTTARLFTSTNESNVAMRGLLAKLGYDWSGVIYNLDKNDPEFIFMKPMAAT